MSESNVVGTTPWLPWPLNKSEWWTKPVPAEPLAALRIGVGAAMIVDILFIYLPAAGDFFGRTSMGSPNMVADMAVAPAWPYSLAGSLENPWLWKGILLLWCLASIGVMLGYWTRVATVVAWLLAMCVSASNPWLRNSGDSVLLITLFYLMFCPSNAMWSLDRPRRGAGDELVLIPPWPLRLLFLQLCVIYFMNGVLKLTEPSWRDGNALYYIMRGAAYTRWSYEDFALPYWFLKFNTWFVLAWEVGFPLLVLSRWTRAATLWIGVLFHVGTALILTLAAFPMYMLCLYLPLLPWERWRQEKQAKPANR
jgi:hypothetical protein